VTRNALSSVTMSEDGGDGTPMPEDDETNMEELYE
jgi:hypothetical protein